MSQGAARRDSGDADVASPATLKLHALADAEKAAQAQQLLKQQPHLPPPHLLSASPATMSSASGDAMGGVMPWPSTSPPPFMPRDSHDFAADHVLSSRAHLASAPLPATVALFSPPALAASCSAITAGPYGGAFGAVTAPPALTRIRTELESDDAADPALSTPALVAAAANMQAAPPPLMTRVHTELNMAVVEERAPAVRSAPAHVFPVAPPPLARLQTEQNQHDQYAPPSHVAHVAHPVSAFPAPPPRLMRMQTEQHLHDDEDDSHDVPAHSVPPPAAVVAFIPGFPALTRGRTEFGMDDEEPHQLHAPSLLSPAALHLGVTAPPMLTRVHTELNLHDASDRDDDDEDTAPTRKQSMEFNDNAIPPPLLTRLQTEQDAHSADPSGSVLPPHVASPLMHRVQTEVRLDHQEQFHAEPTVHAAHAHHAVAGLAPMLLSRSVTDFHQGDLPSDHAESLHGGSQRAVIPTAATATSVPAATPFPGAFRLSRQITDVEPVKLALLPAADTFNPDCSPPARAQLF